MMVVSHSMMVEWRVLVWFLVLMWAERAQKQE